MKFRTLFALLLTLALFLPGCAAPDDAWDASAASGPEEHSPTAEEPPPGEEELLEDTTPEDDVEEDPYLHGPFDENNPAYVMLLEPVVFAYSAIGAAPQTPSEIYALQYLLSLESANEYFHMLEQNANANGKLYALCGLYHTDYEYYKQVIEEYAVSEELCTTQSGCIRQEEPIRYIVVGNEDWNQRFPDVPTVELRDNQHSLDEWRAENGDPISYRLNFYGGGIPKRITHSFRRVQ